MFEDQLRDILSSKVGISKEIKESLFTEILRAHTLSKTPLGRKEGATFMTAESSMEGDKFMRGEKTKNIEKPKSI